MLFTSASKDRREKKQLLRVNPAEDKYLHEEAARRGITIADLIRMCIEKTLKPNAEKAQDSAKLQG